MCPSEARSPPFQGALMLKPNPSLSTAFKDDIIVVFARGGGIGITFEIAKQVDALNIASVRVVGPTFQSEQLAEAAVNAAGGEVKFIKTILAAINAALKELFAGSVPGTPVPAGNVIDRLNAAFANAFEFYLDTSGSPQIKVKAGF